MARALPSIRRLNGHFSGRDWGATIRRSANSLRWRSGLGSWRRGGGVRQCTLSRSRAGNSNRPMVKFRRQGVRTEAELHQGFSFRKAGGGKTVHGLIAEHGIASLRIPLAGRVSVKVPFPDERALDFFDAVGLQMKAREALIARKRAGLDLTCGSRLMLRGVRRGMTGSHSSACRRVHSCLAYGPMSRSRVGGCSMISGGMGRRRSAGLPRSRVYCQSRSSFGWGTGDRLCRSARRGTLRRAKCAACQPYPGCQNHKTYAQLAN